MRFVAIFVLAVVLAACEATVPAPEPIIYTATPQPVTEEPLDIPPTRTPVPTNTRQPLPPSVTPEPTIPPEPTLVELNISPLLEVDFEPPLRIQLPPSWVRHSDALLMPELDNTVAVPFGFYSGPVSGGGTGNIIVLYGFSSLIPAGMQGASANLYGDALRMLLFAIIEPTCEYSFEEETTYMIAGRQVRGTIFAANSCPDGLPSLQGWFGALNVEGLNFAFYAYTEPFEALTDLSRAELQRILDSVEFDLSLLPTIVPVAP